MDVDASDFKIHPSAQNQALLQASTQPSNRRSGTNISRNLMHPNDDLVSLFECPVCFDYVLPPIIQVYSYSVISASF